MRGFANLSNKIAAAIFLAPLGTIAPAAAQPGSSEATGEPGLTYADLVDLADASQLVVRVTVARQAEVEPERAPGLAAGFARLYVEAETLTLISGHVPVGESLRYLVDVPRDAKGRAPKLKKQEFVLFARSVPGRPSELQLVDPYAQLPWSAQLDARLRAILAGLVSPDSLPPITGVSDALSVEGNLVGESETQLFLETQTGDPVSITVLRRPRMAPSWGVSGSELVDQSAQPPARETIDWYRLACFLPRTLPRAANLSNDAESRQRASEDYAFVLSQLGPCTRNRS